MYLGIILIFVAVAGVGAIVLIVVTARQDGPAANRLQRVRAGHGASPPVLYSPAGMVVPPAALNQAEIEAARRARQENNSPTLRDRLIQAGLYRAYSPATFAIARVIVAAIPLGIGVTAGMFGVTQLWIGLLIGAIAAGFATLAPSFWLDYKKSCRQKQLRRSLPDALDVIVVCLEGGVSLTGAFARVSQELASVHPLLATELRIVQREVQMGRSTGEALRNFAKRFDLEELRSLAGVITQAERFGTSIVKALSIYADSMRVMRHQRAEKLAHQATIKMIFPTMFCIFPALFIVLLGPAAIRMYQVFGPGGTFGR